MKFLATLNRPWVHFLVLGVLLFQLNAYVFPPPKPVVGPLTEARLADVIRQSRLPGGGDQNVAQLLDRAAAHLFVHAGELSAIASLVGTPDIGLPGAMRYSAGGRAR